MLSPNWPLRQSFNIWLLAAFLALPANAQSDHAQDSSAQSDDAHKNKVYKWTDANGRVHFGDRPQQQDAKTITVYTNSAPVPPPDVSQRAVARDKLLRAYALERAEKQLSKTQARQAKIQQRQQCSEQKRKLASLETTRYLYRTVDGKQQILEESERANYLAALRKAISSQCS